MDDVILKRGEVSRKFQGSGGTHAVADVTLCVVNVGGGTVVKDLRDGFHLLNVAHGRGGGVGIDEIDLGGLDACDGESLAHALSLALGVGQYVVGCVGIDTVADDFGDNVGSARLRVFEAFQSVNAATFGNDDAVTRFIEGAAGFVDVVGVRAECALAFEAGENTEGLYTLADATGQCQIDLAEAQHLQRLDQARVACRACRSYGIVWASYAHVDRNLSGWVVGHGAGIVVVRPVAGVVVELRDVIDLVLRFHIAVFGGAYVDADSALVVIFKIDATVSDGLACRVDGDAAGAGADAQFFAGLMLFWVKVADARRHFPHVAHIDHLDTCDSIEEVLAILFERIAVGRCQADACYDYA